MFCFVEGTMRRNLKWASLLFLVLTSLLSAADLTGTWQFSVDLDQGGHGDPVFTLKQTGTALSGTYKGPLGEYPVTGNVTGERVELSFTFDRDGQSIKAVYKGKLESDGKLSGTLDFGGGTTTGKWVAVRQ